MAEHLREQILRGDIGDPFPGSRALSETLGVSRHTVDRALRELQREGFLRIEPNRGIRLLRNQRAASVKPAAQRQTVHLLYYVHNYPEVGVWLHWIAPLSERLHQQGIHLTLERCTDARFRAIADHDQGAGDLFYLTSVPPKYHELFARAHKNCLIIGQPAPNVRLPFLQLDQAGTVRHATQHLLRRSCSKIDLVIGKITALGIQSMVERFRTTCADWPHQPVHGKVISLPLESDASIAAARHYASSLAEPHGILVVAPIPVGLILTALARYERKTHGGSEVIAVMAQPESVRVCPRPAYYPYPVRAWVKTLTDAAVHYFETGSVPPIRKTLSVELVPAAEPRG